MIPWPDTRESSGAKTEAEWVAYGKRKHKKLIEKMEKDGLPTKFVTLHRKVGQ